MPPTTAMQTRSPQDAFIHCVVNDLTVAGCWRGMVSAGIEIRDEVANTGRILMNFKKYESELEKRTNRSVVVRRNRAGWSHDSWRAVFRYGV